MTRENVYVLALAAAMIALIAAATLAIPWQWPPQPPQPKIGAVTDQGEITLPLYTVASGDHGIRIALELPEPAHAWVASYSLPTGPLALFPSAQLRTTVPPNPLPAGTTVLPGSYLGNELWWPMPTDPGITEYAVAVALDPQPELDALLAGWTQMGNTLAPDLSMGTYAPETGAEPRRGERLAGVLHEALTRAEDMPADGSMLELEPGSGMWLAAFQIRVPGSK